MNLLVAKCKISNHTPYLGDAVVGLAASVSFVCEFINQRRGYQRRQV